MCLVYSPTSNSCVKDFGFFAVANKSEETKFYDPYLSLSPVDELNGPSYVQALNEAGRMAEFVVSWQLADWGSENNKYTIGGNVEGAFEGILKQNFILASSPWLFCINYQGIQYAGIRIGRNESMYYSSVDPLDWFLQIPFKDFAPLKQQWELIPGITCQPDKYYGL